MNEQLTPASLVPPHIRFFRLVLPFVWLVILILPGYVFFSSRAGLAFLEGADFGSASRRLFPLVGLYAFTLVWSQVVLGSGMNLWRKVYPKIEGYHRKQGVFTLLFAITHPTLLLIGVGPTAYFTRTYVAPELMLFVWFGYVQLFLLILTALAALLRKKIAWLRARWRVIHVLNYLVFILVWFHSWFLGSDVQPTNLKYLWWFFGATAIVTTCYRIADVRRRKSQPSEMQAVREAP